jgi:peroxiredoxin
MTIYNRFFSICAAALLLLTASFAMPNQGEAGDTKRTTVSDFTLKTLDGKTAKLSDYKGKVVVVAFWATWCKPCLQEMRFLKQYYKDHKKDGLVVLAVTTDGPDTLADVRSMVKSKRWKMPVLLDPDGEALAKYNPRGTQPFSFFVDRSGKMALQHEGFAMGDETKYLGTIEKLLAEKP